jgi:CRP-like cAMP-binding protein
MRGEVSRGFAYVESATALAGKAGSGIGLSDAAADYASAISAGGGDVACRPETWLEIGMAQSGQMAARARQVILRAGEPLDGVPVLSDGWAVCVSRLSDGRRQILSFLLPGDLISASAVFAERLSFFVEAVTAVRYVYLDRQKLTDRVVADPKMFNALIRSFLAEREQADQLAVDLGRRSARERIARLLLHFRERLEARNLVVDETFDIPLRQQHIADATGLTAVHVNRVLGALRSERVVEVLDGRLKIVDLRSLCRITDVR